MFVITTDGMENSSRLYSSKQVKDMIERQKEKYGWEFVFVGANIDAVSTAREFGIDESRAVNYHADAKGTACLYNSVSEAVSNIRAGVELDATWSRGIRDDFKSRKQHR